MPVDQENRGTVSDIVVCEAHARKSYPPTPAGAISQRKQERRRSTSARSAFVHSSRLRNRCETLARRPKRSRGRKHSAGLGAQEELLQGRGDRVTLTPAQRFDEGLVGGQYHVQRLRGKPLAPLGELDEHPPPIPRIGPALYEPGPLEPVEPRGHRPGGDQRRPGEIGGFHPLLVTASTKGVED